MGSNPVYGEGGKNGPCGSTMIPMEPEPAQIMSLLAAMLMRTQEATCDNG